MLLINMGVVMCWVFLYHSQDNFTRKHNFLIHNKSYFSRVHTCWSSEEEEEFLVLPEQSVDALELMEERRDRLQRGEPVRAQLDRQPQAFRKSPNANAMKFELPPEFYNLTAEELKREQQQRYTQFTVQIKGIGSTLLIKCQ